MKKIVIVFIALSLSPILFAQIEVLQSFDLGEKCVSLIKSEGLNQIVLEDIETEKKIIIYSEDFEDENTKKLNSANLLSSIVDVKYEDDFLGILYYKQYALFYGLFKIIGNTKTFLNTEFVDYLPFHTVCEYSLLDPFTIFKQKSQLYYLGLPIEPGQELPPLMEKVRIATEQDTSSITIYDPEGYVQVFKAENRDFLKEFESLVIEDDSTLLIYDNRGKSQYFISEKDKNYNELLRNLYKK